jgi:2-polyprenyl-6-methoxyphenol hydroxylase-like FAD-dependent oxidoreductase
MPLTPFDTDILVVGAGPVGLFVANECARRGIRFRIIEARSTQSQHSKALAIFPRTLEIFDMAGIVDPFLKAANRVTSVSVISNDHALARMHFAPEQSPYRFIAMVPQDVTEQLLVDQLQHRGGRVEYDTSFVTAVQHEDHLRVTLEQNGQRSEATAAYVVGCDGAHSPVRHLLNLPFEGASYQDTFLLADIDTNQELPADELQLCPNAAGPLAIFPMSATRRRVVATVNQTEGEAPSLELVQRLLADRAPRGIQALALRWSSYFRIHHRHVANLQVGRMFIAGDAAHIHSPFGGQGMNTGLHDVWNLVWKLDLALQGHATAQLLDSYTTERIPVIKQVIETTDRLTKVMGTPSKFAQAVRNAVIPMVSRLAPFQHAFVQRLSELGIAYPDSPIVDGAGERYLDRSLRGGNGVRSRFVLVLDDHADESLAQGARELASRFPDVLDIRNEPHHQFMLVRPDGYIAYSANSHDSATTIRSVRELLERQVA